MIWGATHGLTNLDITLVNGSDESLRMLGTVDVRVQIEMYTIVSMHLQDQGMWELGQLIAITHTSVQCSVFMTSPNLSVERLNNPATMTLGFIVLKYDLVLLFYASVTFDL